MSLQEITTIGDFVAKDFRTAAIFTKYGIDFFIIIFILTNYTTAGTNCFFRKYPRRNKYIFQLSIICNPSKW